MALFLKNAFSQMNTPCPANEATSSGELSNLTGRFLNYLNEHVPADRMLKGFEWILDSVNPGTSETTSQAFLPLLRPDFQLFVRNVLIFSWENKIDKADLGEAMEENVLKLKVWSPLYYGTMVHSLMSLVVAVLEGSLAEALSKWQEHCF